MTLAAAPPPADPTTTYVLMGGVAVMIVYVMTRMNRRRKKDPFDEPFRTRSLAQQRNTEREMENLLVQFSEMARQMTGQLDTRAAKLEALIQDADERLARLKAAVQQAPTRPEFAIVPPHQPAETPLMPVDDMAPAPTVDAQHEAVYRLADEGKPPREIAATLGRPSGEVELILALRPRA